MARSKKADAVQVINNETEEIREVSIYDVIRDSYLEFGGYINNNRSLPRIIDGLKVSYRRLLYSALQYPKGKLVKSATLLGRMMDTHPHSTDGSYGIVSAYVKTGIFEGQDR
jgi:DNA gyrase/topoisomerase IV subunit A